MAKKKTADADAAPIQQNDQHQQNEPKKVATEIQSNKDLLLSYMELRTFIGVLGIVLPFLCVIGGLTDTQGRINDSISMYYYYNTGDIFVGILVCVGLFLWTYHGYTKADDRLTGVTGVCACGIAFFPCKNPDLPGTFGLFRLDPDVSNAVHLSFAVLFFLLLAVNSIFFFTKSDDEVEKGSAKYKRNIVYRACGIVMLATLAVLIPLGLWGGEEFLQETKLILICEIIMLFAFGISWLVKGGAILADEKPFLLAFAHKNAPGPKQETADQ